MSQKNDLSEEKLPKVKWIFPKNWHSDVILCPETKSKSGSEFTHMISNMMLLKSILIYIIDSWGTDESGLKKDTRNCSK